MAAAVEQKKANVALACRAFGVSERCYRYERKLRRRTSGSPARSRASAGHIAPEAGLCFLHLRNVKGHGWNHKRVYRIYRDLELNLRIKRGKWLKRDVPEELAVPEKPNVMWPMELMADRLEAARAFRQLNVLDSSIVKVWALRRASRCRPNASPARSTGSSNGADAHRPYGWITAQNLSVAPCYHGRRNGASRSAISSPASRSRMPLRRTL